MNKDERAMRSEAEKREIRARLWAGFMRDAARQAIQAAVPGLKEESMPYIKLQILTRTFLLSRVRPYLQEAEDCTGTEQDRLIESARPELMEELVAPALPEYAQMELAVFMLACLEGSEPFDTLFTGAVFDEPAADERAVRMAEALQEKALEVLNGYSEQRHAERCPKKDPLRPVFPPDYPYMDEFEYIDHCIAGDDD